MGYTTEFKGKFKLNKPLDEETYTFLVKLSETRRVKRMVAAKYGVEGEFYVDGTGHMGQDVDATVTDSNHPPSTQPSLWCQWTPSKDKKSIIWDEGEKFYNYIEWIEYIIQKVLAPKGYTLNGKMKWKGEDWDDIGTIEIIDNQVYDGKTRIHNNATRFIMSIEMTLEEAYLILGSNPQCTLDNIKKRYKTLALERHPDTQSGNDKDFIKLKEAYDIIKKSRK